MKIKLKKVNNGDWDLGSSYFVKYFCFFRNQKVYYSYSYDIKDGENVEIPKIEGFKIRKITQRANFVTIYLDYAS